ncbi:hypothetical protein GCM10010191_87400 [Actinomadura vinacea]|uniref:DUF397 domain-containing protein n=1 Tax=Actinomadura vinacea TaxID=115336 RepID=A0ABP5XLY4_9ACTN
MSADAPARYLSGPVEKAPAGLRAAKRHDIRSRSFDIDIRTNLLPCALRCHGARSFALTNRAIAVAENNTASQSWS